MIKGKNNKMARFTCFFWILFDFLPIRCPPSSTSRARCHRHQLFMWHLSALNLRLHTMRFQLRNRFAGFRGVERSRVRWSLSTNGGHDETRRRHPSKDRNVERSSHARRRRRSECPFSGSCRGLASWEHSLLLTLSQTSRRVDVGRCEPRTPPRSGEEELGILPVRASHEPRPVRQAPSPAGSMGISRSKRTAPTIQSLKRTGPSRSPNTSHNKIGRSQEPAGGHRVSVCAGSSPLPLGRRLVRLDVEGASVTIRTDPSIDFDDRFEGEELEHSLEQPEICVNSCFQKVLISQWHSKHGLNNTLLWVIMITHLVSHKPWPHTLASFLILWTNMSSVFSFGLQSHRESTVLPPVARAEVNGLPLARRLGVHQRTTPSILCSNRQGPGSSSQRSFSSEKVGVSVTSGRKPAGVTWGLGPGPGWEGLLLVKTSSTDFSPFLKGSNIAKHSIPI